MSTVLPIRIYTRREVGACARARRRRLDVLGAAALQFLLALGALRASTATDTNHLRPQALLRMEVAIEKAIGQGQLPGGVLWVECQGASYHRAFGCRSLAPSTEPMTEDTIFDVASLTKVLATTPALMLLIERNQVTLDQPVATYLPEYQGGGKEAVTVRHLLTHTSGLGRHSSSELDWYDFQSAFNLLCAQKLVEPPGKTFFYSDINFILLGELIQRISGQRLDTLCAEQIFGPLGMVDTKFCPTRTDRPRIAPTETIGRDVLRGIVHDSKAQAMGGVAGHAGLFTTAPDVARFARMILNRGTLDGTRLFQPETVRLMTSVQSPPEAKARRGLGWDIDSDFSHPRGDLFPVGSFGHTGFTGVCLWIDPYSQTFWMFFSNRLHPEPSGDIRPLQAQLGTLAAKAVKDFDFSRVPNTPIPVAPLHESTH